jgi:hypothetical protein
MIRPVMLKLSLPSAAMISEDGSPTFTVVSGTRWERHPKRGSASIEVVRPKSDLGVNASSNSILEVGRSSEAVDMM